MPNPYLDSILNPTPAKPQELEPGVHVFPPAEPAGPPAPPARGLGDYFKSIGFAPEADEVTPFVQAHARLGIPWEATAEGLKSRFGDGTKPTAVKPLYDLARAKQEQSTQGVGTLEAFARSYMPFTSAIDGTAAGRAVGTKGTREYAEAQQRFARGEATADDIQRIARYERLEEIDRQVGSTFGGKAVQALGGAGQVLGEFGVAGKAVGAAGKALGVGEAAAGATLGLRARVGQKLATTAAVTPLVPSMYAEKARQKNMEAGRADVDDWRGYPAAVGLAFVNNLVLGSVQKLATNPAGRIGKLATATGTGAAGRAAGAGAIGAGEQAGVDVAAGALDEFLPKAYKTDTKYGVLGDLARGKAGEAGQHAAIQMLTFAAFAAGHNRAPDKVVDAFKAAVDATDPATVARAAAPLSAAVKADPNITRAEAAKVARTSPEGPVRSYLESLADTLPADAWANENTFGQRENPAGVPEQVKPPEPKREPVTVELHRGVPAGTDPRSTAGAVGDGLFYSPNPAVAQSYADRGGAGGGRVVTDKVTFKNLLAADNWQDAKAKLGLPRSTDMTGLMAAATEKGFDGMTFRGSRGPEYIALKGHTSEPAEAAKPAAEGASSQPGNMLPEAPPPGRFEPRIGTPADWSKMTEAERDRAGAALPDSYRQTYEQIAREIIGKGADFHTFGGYGKDAKGRIAAGEKPEGFVTFDLNRVAAYRRIFKDLGYDLGEPRHDKGGAGYSFKVTRRPEAPPRAAEVPSPSPEPAAPKEPADPLASWSDRDVWDAAVALTGLKSKTGQISRVRAVNALRDANIPPALLSQFRPKEQLKPREAPPRAAEPPAAAEPPKAEIAPEAKPGALDGLIERAGLAGRVEKLPVADLGGDNARVLGYDDGRFVLVQHDPAAKRLTIDFGDAEGSAGEVTGVGQKLRAGTTDLLKDLRTLAEHARDAGQSVAFSAEPRRARLYARALVGAGFTRAKGPPEGAEGVQTYEFTPGLTPAARMKQSQLQRPPAEAKPQIDTRNLKSPIDPVIPGEEQARVAADADPREQARVVMEAAGLTAREKHVLAERLAGRSLEDIGANDADKLAGARVGKKTGYTREAVRLIEKAALDKLGLDNSITRAVHAESRADGIGERLAKGEAVDLAELRADPELQKAVARRVPKWEREHEAAVAAFRKDHADVWDRTEPPAEAPRVEPVPAGDAASPAAAADRPDQGGAEPGRPAGESPRAKVGKKSERAAPAEPWEAEAAALARRSRPQLLKVMEKIDPEGVAAGRHATKTPAELAKAIALNRSAAGAEAAKLSRSKEKEAAELAKRNSKAQLLDWIAEHRPDQVKSRAYNAYSREALARILIRVRAEAEAQAKGQARAEKKANAQVRQSTIAKAVSSRGGIVWDSAMEQFYRDRGHAAENGFPMHVIVPAAKGGGRQRGNGIDALAVEMHEAGELPDAEPQTLIDMLEGKRVAHDAELGDAHEKALHDFHEQQQQEAEAQARDEAEQEAADRAAAESHQGEAEFDPASFDVAAWGEGFPEPPPRAGNEGERGGVGMAHGGEFIRTPGGPRPPREYAHARAEVTRERERRGESPVAAAVRLSNPEAWDQAVRTVRADPTASERLVADLERQPRPTTSTENAVLLQRRIALANAHDAASREYITARLRQVPDAQAEVLKRREQDTAAERDRLDRVVAAAGTQLGRGLQFFRQLAAEDYSLTRMLQRAEVAKGKPLTDAETAKVKQLSDRIAELEKRLREAEAGGKVPDKGQPGDLTDIKINRRKGGQEFDTLIDELTRAGQSRPRKVFEAAKDTANLLRAFMTAFDLPPVFRQGGFVSLGNPLRAAKAFGEGVKSILSTRAADRALQDILDRPNSVNGSYKAGGVEFTDPNGKLSAQEEAFMASRFRFEGLRAKTGLAASERGYTTFLNRLRADTFDALAATVARDGQPTPKELKAIGNATNVFTGRGNLGSFDRAAVPLAQVFFSPRYLVSRFQTLVGQPLHGGTAASRKAIATEYAKTAIGLGVLYSLVKAANSDAEITFDPRSTDFGKIKLGNYRLDPMFGMSQLIVAGTKSVGGAEKSVGTGKVTPLRGPGVPYGGRDVGDVMESFGRGKLAPIPGVGFDLLRGNRIDRKPVTAESEAGGLLLPISWGDVTDAMKDQGVPRGAAVALAALLGMGGQLHEQRQKGQKEPEPLLPVLGDTDQPVRKGRVGKRMEPRF